jgi:hypothetical protein
MKLFKGLRLMGALCIVASSALRASDDDVLKRILAKYEMSKKAKTQSSMSGDLATQLRPNSKPLEGLQKKEDLQDTVRFGKELKDEIRKVDDKKLESIEKGINSDTEELEEIKDGVVEKKPGFFTRLFNYVPGILKVTNSVTEFNKKAAENLARFKITFKNVSDALVSFGEDRVLMPQKIKGNYVLDKETGAIQWNLVQNKLNNEKLRALKQECLYIIIKEMVDGFNHLDPIVGKGINAFSFIAPHTAKQSVLLYEIATKFLPMLEKIAKENLDSSVTKESVDSSVKNRK